ncbi:MAG: hypothetical protein J7M38_04700, partial [Armatimonadetes bacterium]|nr:hypothetical protein [Armatimonadota bacterium]
MTTTRMLSVALALTVTATGWGATWFFDMGTPDSKVWEGAIRVTPETIYSADTGFGWQAGDGMAAQVRVWEEMGSRRGRPAPPDMWSNAVTEDALVGEQESVFLLDVPDGDYNVYVLCGISDRNRYMFWDFDVSVGTAGDDEPAAISRVQAEGAFQYTPVRLRAHVAGDRLAVKLLPHSKWVVNCIMVYDDDDADTVEADIIRPLEEWTFFLPPEQQANWELEPSPPPGEYSPLTREDVDRGYLVFHRPWPEVVYPNARPRPEELNPTLRIFASPGEYEPLTVSVHLLDAVNDLNVSVSDIGPVPADSVDIRHVRYMRARPNYTTVGSYRIVPDVLEPMYMFRDRRRYNPVCPVCLRDGSTHRFWLTVHVPEDAEPGMYEGSVTITADGERSATVPVRLRILPIELREDPDKIYGIYYRDPIDYWSRAKDDYSKEHFLRRAEMEREDLVAHGIRNVVTSAWIAAADEEGNFHPDWTLLEMKMEWAERYGFKPPYAVHINTGGVYRKYMGKGYGSHTSEAEIPPPEFAAEITAMVKLIEQERVRRGWPTFLYYPIDEPGRDEKSVALMKIVLKAIRDAGAPTYVTADPTYDQFQPLMPFVNVWCCQPFNPDRDTVLADMAARDVQYWCYPNHVAGENDHTPVAGARMTFGFGFWRSGFVTLIPWIYSSSAGDQFNYLTSSSMDFMNRHEPDGTPIPV